jgi:hypothetical protein
MVDATEQLALDVELMDSDGIANLVLLEQLLG